MLFGDPAILEGRSSRSAWLTWLDYTVIIINSTGSYPQQYVKSKRIPCWLCTKEAFLACINSSDWLPEEIWTVKNHMSGALRMDDHLKEKAVYVRDVLKPQSDSLARRTPTEESRVALNKFRGVDNGWSLNPTKAMATNDSLGSIDHLRALHAIGIKHQADAFNCLTSSCWPILHNISCQQFWNMICAARARMFDAAITYPPKSLSLRSLLRYPKKISMRKLQMKKSSSWPYFVK